MGDIKTKYGSSSKAALTITLHSLAATTGTTGRESTAVDNSSNLYLDALVMVTVKLPNSGTIGAKKMCSVYAYGALEAASPTWPDKVTASDAAITLTDPTQLRLIGVVSCPAINDTYKSEPMSVAAAFGGILPPQWGIVVLNQTNVALDSTGNSAEYLGVLAQSL